MSDPVLAAENVRLSNELRRTRIQLAKAMVALVEIEQTTAPGQKLPPIAILQKIYNKTRTLWSELDECI